MGGTVNYVPGWINHIIALGATVPAGTGGDIGLNFGNNPGSFSGSDWRYAKRIATGLVYWNGAAWTAVPATWSDPGSVLLYPIAVWQEGTTRHTRKPRVWPRHAHGPSNPRARGSTWKASGDPGVGRSATAHVDAPRPASAARGPARGPHDPRWRAL